MSEKPARCDMETRTCRQTIHLKSPRNRPIKHGQYVMTVEYKKNKESIKSRNQIQQQQQQHIVSVPIYVVVRPSKQAKHAPRFVNTPSEFFLFRQATTTSARRLSSDAMIMTGSRNASIFVAEDESASLLNSGFHLDLLNPDMTPLGSSPDLGDSPFEIVPNYGHGFLSSSLRVKNSIVGRRALPILANQKYDLIVGLFYWFFFQPIQNLTI